LQLEYLGFEFPDPLIGAFDRYRRFVHDLA
jgi:hypothetical protein